MTNIMAVNPKPGRKLHKKDSSLVRKIEKKESPNKAVRKAKIKAEEKNPALSKTKSGSLKKGYGKSFGGRGKALPK